MSEAMNKLMRAYYRGDIAYQDLPRNLQFYLSPEAETNWDIYKSYENMMDRQYPAQGKNVPYSNDYDYNGEKFYQDIENKTLAGPNKIGTQPNGVKDRQDAQIARQGAKMQAEADAAMKQWNWGMKPMAQGTTGRPMTPEDMQYRQAFNAMSPSEQRAAIAIENQMQRDARATGEPIEPINKAGLKAKPSTGNMQPLPKGTVLKEPNGAWWSNTYPTADGIAYSPESGTPVQGVIPEPSMQSFEEGTIGRPMSRDAMEARQYFNSLSPLQQRSQIQNAKNDNAYFSAIGEPTNNEAEYLRGVNVKPATKGSMRPLPQGTVLKETGGNWWDNVYGGGEDGLVYAPQRNTMVEGVIPNQANAYENAVKAAATEMPYYDDGTSFSPDDFYPREPESYVVSPPRNPKNKKLSPLPKGKVLKESNSKFLYNNSETPHPDQVDDFTFQTNLILEDADSVIRNEAAAKAKQYNEEYGTNYKPEDFIKPSNKQGAGDLTPSKAELKAAVSGKPINSNAVAQEKHIERKMRPLQKGTNLVPKAMAGSTDPHTHLGIKMTTPQSGFNGDYLRIADRYVPQEGQVLMQKDKYDRGFAKRNAARDAANAVAEAKVQEYQPQTGILYTEPAGENNINKQSNPNGLKGLSTRLNGEQTKAEFFDRNKQTVPPKVEMRPEGANKYFDSAKQKMATAGMFNWAAPAVAAKQFLGTPEGNKMALGLVGLSATAAVNHLMNMGMAYDTARGIAQEMGDMGLLDFSDETYQQQRMNQPE